MQKLSKTTLLCILTTLLLGFNPSRSKTRKRVTNRNLKEDVINLKEDVIKNYEMTQKVILIGSGLNLLLFILLMSFIRKKQKQDEATVDWLVSETKSGINTQFRQLKKMIKSLEGQVETLSSKDRTPAPKNMESNPNSDKTDDKNIPSIHKIQGFDLD